MNDYRNAIALIDEGLEVFTNLIDSVTRHGNYSAESTCTFIDQGAAAVREARALISAIAPVEPVAVAWPEGFSVIPPIFHVYKCSSDDCSQHASIRMERGGVGSIYCEPCARKIVAALATPVAPTPSAEDDLVAVATELFRCIDQVQSRPATPSIYGIYHPESHMARQVERLRSLIALRNERTRAGGAA